MKDILLVFKRDLEQKKKINKANLSPMICLKDNLFMSKSWRRQKMMPNKSK